jgi:hypothetical protein
MSTMTTMGSVSTWTARRFFDALTALGPLRVISPSGPSTFEAICEVGAFGIANGYLNAITDSYHWHLKLDGFRHLRSRDEVHARSGRRVLLFELRSAEDAAPFLLVYLHRAKGEEFGRKREGLFADLNRELAAGVHLQEVG